MNVKILLHPTAVTIITYVNIDANTLSDVQFSTEGDKELALIWCFLNKADKCSKISGRFLPNTNMNIIPSNRMKYLHRKTTCISESQKRVCA